MIDALNRQLAETGQPTTEDPVTLTKIVLDSLALRYASVLATIERLTGAPIAGVQIVGGGCQNEYLNEATAGAAGKPVVAGPIEATALGNLLVQAIARGRFAGLADARAHVRALSPAKRHLPTRTADWAEAARRFAALEARFLG
jgi:rhamnulokinase